MTNLAGELAFEFPALPERVWDALTNQTKIAAWFAENDFIPEVGRPFTLRPLAASGVDGPIHGDILEIDPPTRLIMRWRLATGDVVITWQVDPALGGSRLRVAQTGILGPGQLEGASFTGAEAIYRRLFDERLRAFLRGGMLGRLAAAAPAPGKPLLPPPSGTPGGGSHPTPSRSTTPRPQPRPSPPPNPSPNGPPPRPVPAARPQSEPGSYGSLLGGGLTSPSSAVSSFPAVSPPAPLPRRRSGPMPWVAIAVGLVIALALVAWALASSGSPISWGAPGPQGTEVSTLSTPSQVDGPPAGGPTGPGGPSGPGGGQRSPRPGGPGNPPGGPSPGASVVVSSSANGPPVALQASFVVSPGPLGYVVAMSVTNPSGVDQTWRNLAVTFDGLSVTVSDVEGTVLYRANGATACFAPTQPAALIPAGATFRFSFKVLAVLIGDVVTATLNQAVCDT